MLNSIEYYRNLANRFAHAYISRNKILANKIYGEFISSYVAESQEDKIQVSQIFRSTVETILKKEEKECDTNILQIIKWIRGNGEA